MNPFPPLVWPYELPEGAILIRGGCWYWWRDARGGVHETLLPDQHYSPLSEEEQRLLLLGECDDR